MLGLRYLLATLARDGFFFFVDFEEDKVLRMGI